MGLEQEKNSRNRAEKHTKHPKKKRKVRKKAIAIILCVILILIVSGLAMAGMSIKPPSLENLSHEEDSERQDEREDGIYNVLVVGTDKVGLNTDTILVMSLDSVNNKANVLSIPRDTMSASIRIYYF